LWKNITYEQKEEEIFFWIFSELNFLLAKTFHFILHIN